MPSLGLQSSLSCPFAWDYAKAEFASPVLKSAFCLRENRACIFQDPRFIPRGRTELMALSSPCLFVPLLWWPAAEETLADEPLGEGAAERIDPW